MGGGYTCLLTYSAETLARPCCFTTDDFLAVRGATLCQYEAGLLNRYVFTERKYGLWGLRRFSNISQPPTDERRVIP